jgi:uncharacterized membrane protein YphA (DoxX/SURF4 family)
VKTFEQFYAAMRSNRWYWLFYLFCRLSLAYAFIVAGLVKVFGERFASGLSAVHPMGAYLEALHHTGYYYTFIGIAQVIAAIMLLIPRTVLLGALLYLPIIVNIWVLSFAVRFEGSIVTAPLMTFANVFLLVWHYDRLRYLLPSLHDSPPGIFKKPERYRTKFPFLFFTMVLLVSVLTVLYAQFGYEIMPRNSISDCKQQFEGSEKQTAGYAFCECIHSEGIPLDQCLNHYNVSKTH